MIINTSELTGPALDWAVAKCEGFKPHAAASLVLLEQYLPTTRWAQAGPIIEREKIGSQRSIEGDWIAFVCSDSLDMEWLERGPTPLIAAMRCYAASKLGDEIEIPEELK